LEKSDGRQIKPSVESELLRRMERWEEGETILLKLLWKRNILFVDDPTADFVGVVPHGFPK
jgi:hypothetical protein